jgi:hypothetical protein
MICKKVMSKKVSSPPPITDDVLREAVSAAQARVEDERERLNEAEECLRSAEHEFALLVRLGRLRGLPGMAECNLVLPSGEEGQVEAAQEHASAAQRAAATGRAALVPTVADILREHGKPMPIRLLMAEVVSRGAKIPGRGEQANLISVLMRAPEIVRLQRGVYGLREWSPYGMEVSSRRTTRRRKAAR